MKFLTLAAIALGVPTAMPLHAQGAPVVVELFTSQGCASCPPADALLMDLAAQENVIALAQHVDYWDYIGWKDIFAQSDFSERQRSYAQVGGREMVYTPQMIINGVEAVVGARSDEITSLIRENEARQNVVLISSDLKGNELSLEAAFAGDAVKGPLLIQVVQYSPLEEVQIARGENAGRRLKYANVVKNWTMLEPWDSPEPYVANVVIDPGQSTAILVQHPGPGEIIGASLVE